MKVFKLFTLTIALFVFNIYSAQTKAEHVELTDLIRNLIQTTKDEKNIKQAFWLPKSYWELALKDSPYGNQSLIDEINAVIENYSIFAVTDVTISHITGIKKNTLTSIHLIVDDTQYAPIEMLPNDIETIVSSIKPMLAKMLGDFGNSIEIFVFDNSNDIIPTNLETSKFTLEVNTTNFDYYLPLSSLVEKKICPVDKKAHNGNWMFCPWHGKKLK
ncbi:hypothetical protein [uncultured Psychroserpens sp.]|uniref:hypothetical protein n=1 Tax=uncultured Psychroserpens sp. TaxID=255436 RepID=UPI00261CFE93|nr:hypothetical protein [uncultured Psychroserpens sp.]